MKFWKVKFFNSNKKSFKVEKIKGLTSRMLLVSQIFKDLCFFRNWKKLKVLKTNLQNDYFIIGCKSYFKKTQKILEIFIPGAYNSSVISLHNLIHINLQSILMDFSQSMYIVNLAIIDRDSSITYYKISKGIKKTIGPLL